MIDSIFRVIVKVQMFFAVRAARKQARKDIAIEESYGDSGLFVKEEQPWDDRSQHLERCCLHPWQSARTLMGPRESQASRIRR